MAQLKEAKIWEFGDFQTPMGLAEMSVTHLRKSDPDFLPKTIIEPTCGVGAFLFASADAFPNAERFIGVEIDDTHFKHLEARRNTREDRAKFSLIQGDFFKIDWESVLQDAPKPILIIGNPPWVTSADIGRLKGSNLPEKSNFQKYDGLEAVTGKANFDISEWMLLKHLDWISDHSGCVAMLCKSAVARKILRQAWKAGVPTTACTMVKIDAMANFSAAVDACFFTIKTNGQQASTDCHFFENFEDTKPSQVFGYHEGTMLSDVPAFYRYHDLLGADPNYVWRSGIKHDCSKVMELKIEDDSLRNGNGESVDVEATYLYPLLKSSDLGNARITTARYKTIVPQKRIGEPTDGIRKSAPKTWAYLIRNSDMLDKRGSVIYKNKPRFSIFGVGDYTFTDWKIAISGFYKRLYFPLIAPIDGRPVVFDDTIYVLDAKSYEEAVFLHEILNTHEAKAFLASMAFWSDKRPITAELLKRLHIGNLAKALGRYDEYQQFVRERCDLPMWKVKSAV